MWAEYLVVPVTEAGSCVLVEERDLLKYLAASVALRVNKREM